ncbi:MULTISPECIES: HlyD family secretion protein [Stenotrophomonas maltophilia group]|uniref:HlyD family secretion protein n=1 Tax=Stenotrophomonas maltophilia TaxID=40324 RepID=UPI0012FDCDF3|nr:HlyD family efflux transporter periplasmic adaptor subunit [Stenotrophomonas maltophilia]HDS1214008.1 HlyD family efflux transporter periplasmic adaptor subunit [Stenotrophomonas maltophilia]
MARNIFRREVLEARANQWLGDVRVATPLSLKMGVAISFLAALIVIAFLTFGSYTRRENANGVIVSDKGVINVRASEAGEVSGVEIKEGEVVSPGTLLVSVRTDKYFGSERGLSSELSHDLAHQYRDLEASKKLNAEKSEVRSQALLRSRRLVLQRRQQAVAELAIYQREVGERQQQVDKVAPLVKDGYMSETQYRDLRAQLASARANLERQRSAILQLDQEAQQLDREMAEESYSASLDQRERSVRLSELSSEAKKNSALGVVQLRASQAGKVAAVVVKPGETVSAGQILAVVVPAGAKMEVELRVPSESIGFVSVGTPVLLKLTSYPHEKFGLQKGEVSFVSLAPVPGVGAGAEDTTYLVRVQLKEQRIKTPDGERQLMPGMTASVNLLLDKRRLYEWVLRPAYQLPEAN